MRARWRGQTIAESDDTVVVEGNHYFPSESLDRQFFTESEKKTVCPWKGEASYYHVVVNGELNTDAAWTYRAPKEAAGQIKDHVAFWRGVEVEA